MRPTIEWRDGPQGQGWGSHEPRFSGYDSSRQADAIDESTVRAELTERMVLAGVMAVVDWRERCTRGDTLSDADLVSGIHVAMRRKQRAGSV